MLHKPKALILDMDGVLVDSERVEEKVWKEAGRQLGYRITHDFYLDLIGLGARHAVEELKKNFGDDFPVEAFRDERLKRLEEITQNEGIPLKKGAQELFEYIENLDIPIALATSSGRKLVDDRLPGRSPLFDAIVTGDDVHRAKPNPEIYQIAARNLQANPSECLVVEDSEPGVQSAHKAGMMIALIPDMKPPSEDIKKLADQVLSNLSSLQKMLINWFDHK